MKRKEISNRKELKECLGLYLKFNFLLLKNQHVDCEFIIRIDGKNLKNVSDSEFKCFNKLISHINSKMPEMMNEINSNDDVFILKGYRRNQQFDICEFKKEKLSENSPQIFNYHNENFNIGFEYHIQITNNLLQLDNPNFLFGLITSTMLKNYDNNFKRQLIVKQCFELPKREIQLRMDSVSHLFGNVNTRYNMLNNILHRNPTIVHISKLTNSQLAFRYESPLNVLFSQNVLKSLIIGLVHVLSFMILIYCNSKTFGFSYFYNTFNVVMELFTKYGVSLMVIWHIFWYLAYYLISAYIFFLPIGIVQAVFNGPFIQTFYCYFILNLGIYWKGFVLNLDSDKNYYLSPIELTQNLLLAHIIEYFENNGYLSLLKDWSIQIFEKAKCGITNFFKSLF